MMLTPLQAAGAERLSNDESGLAYMAGLVDQAAVLGSGVRGHRLAGEAAKLARRYLGSKLLRRGGTYDDAPARSTIAVLRLLAQHVEHAGHLALSRTLLESIAVVCAADHEQATLVLTDRARNARKRGRLDLSQAQSEQVMLVARATNNHRLSALASLELAALAQARGNYPELEKWARRALAESKKGQHRRLLAAAQGALGVRLAVKRDFSAAVNHFSEAYRTASPPDLQYYESLANLAQVALDVGDYRNARGIAARALSHTLPFQSAAALIGTYALSAAAADDIAGVRWALSAAQSLTTRPRHPREVAAMLLECARAGGSTGDSRAGQLRDMARDLAIRHGFHEIAFQLAAEHEAEPSASVPLDDTARATLGDIGQFGKRPSRLLVEA